MSRRADPALIGGFVIGAILLMVAAILLFSSGDLFENKPRAVMYFEGSVHGLQPGAPVSFRGVRIGSVREVRLLVDLRDQGFYIPVYVEIDPRRLSGTRGEDYAELDEHISLQQLIDAGLRAQLQLQSLLTGQLFIDLDFMPERPVRLIGLDRTLNEIPTVPNAGQELSELLEENDLQGAVKNAVSALAALDRLLNMPELTQSVRHARRLLASLENVAAGLEERSPLLLARLDELLVKSRSTLQAIEEAARRGDQVLVSGEHSLAAVSRSFAELEQTLKETRELLGEHSQLRYELTAALKEIGNAARAVRSVAEMLDREPEALFSGKSDRGEK